MSELATIERADVEVTPTSWVPSGEMAFEEWCEAGSKLGQLAEAVQWWIGDWINYGATAYGDKAGANALQVRHKYLRALEATGYEYQSLRNMASVAGEFELSRRRDSLSWSHHEAVAGLEPRQQDAVLDKAELEGWSRQQLRTALGSGSNGKPRDPSLTVRVTFEQTFPNRQLQRQTLASLREAADKLGFTEKGG